MCLFALWCKVCLSVEKKDILVDTYDKNGRTRLIVAQNGKLDQQLSDFESYFFEVMYPEDIRYTYRIKAAKSIGSSFTHTFDNMPLIVADPYNACSPLVNVNRVKDNFVLAIRGECSFLSKTINAENAGALGVIIADNDPANEYLIDMVTDETDRVASIPSVFLVWKDGYMIKKCIDEQNLDYATINIPLNLTIEKNSRRLRRAPWSYW